MNETTNLFIMLGLIEDKPDKSNESQEDKDCMNYLSEGERILSLAREKKERVVFKTHNLTVRLCDLKYPRLDVEEYKAKQQIQSAIEREIKKNLKEIKTEECLSSKGIPFLLHFVNKNYGCKIESASNLFEKGLARDVSRSNIILTIKIKDTTFYLPCSPGKRFSNGSYHYKSNPRHFIHMYHAENFFYPLFGINWLNQLKMDSFDDPDIEDTMKHLIRDLVSILENYKWDMTDLPKWFSNYLIDCGYQEDTIHNCYIKASGSESKPATLYKDYFKSHSEVFNLLSFVYGDSYLSYDILLNVSGKSAMIDLPYYYREYIFMTLRHYIANIHDLAEEEKHRNELKRIVARAYQTKKNIPKHVVHKMKSSELNTYFGFIEFDEDVDLNLVDSITEEFKKLNQNIFNGYMNKNVALRFRKLGKHHATGLYYPSIDTMVVDFRHPTSFIHEYFHMLDDMLGDLSMKCEFDQVALQYQQLLISSVEKERKDGKEILPKKGKYNLNYFLRKCEIFARCGEIHLFRNLHIVSSLLKPEETHYFAYPDDKILNSMIGEYYTNLLDRMKNISYKTGEDVYEKDLHIASV